MSVLAARAYYREMAESLAYWLADHTPLGCRECADVALGVEAYSLRLDNAQAAASVSRAPEWPAPEWRR